MQRLPDVFSLGKDLTIDTLASDCPTKTKGWEGEGEGEQLPSGLSGYSERK